MVVKIRTKMPGIIILLLGITPFYWGIDLGSLPAVPLDQGIYLVYFVYCGLLYFILKRDRLNAGGKLLLPIFLFLVFHTIPFALNPFDITTCRNFFETIFLGNIFFYVFLNESNRGNASSNMLDMMVTATLAIAIYMLLEYLFMANPILEKAPHGYIYFSPELVSQAGGVYRPYGTFFTASEAGTFVAMGLPFVWHRFRERLNPVTILLCLLPVSALIINYTRGVWVAVFIACFLFYQKSRRLVFYLAPVTTIVLIILYFMFNNNVFIHRLFDLQNLWNRFFYWKISFQVLADNLLFGVGHMNYEHIYLDYIHTIDQTIDINVQDVMVADNMFLMTLAEKGILGFASLIGLIFAMGAGLKQGARKCLRVGDIQTYHLLQACMISLTIYLVAGMFADVHLFQKVTKLAFITAGWGLAAGTNKTFRGSDNDVETNYNGIGEPE
jgi:O-antigen ligase